MIEEYAAKPFGMILAVGPTGSGKTTTLLGVARLKYCLYIEASYVDYFTKKRMSSDKQFSHLVENINIKMQL